MAPHRALRAIASVTIGLALIGLVAFIAFWVATGGRWFIVQTPSMGTSAPVGTLLWVEPVNTHQLHVGEFINFRPPNSTETFSHRVYRINADGTIETKGQITSPDPWRLQPSDVVGRVDMRWWGMGWLVRAAPILIIGGILAWSAIRRFARPGRRLPMAVFATSVLLCIAIVVLQPLTRAEKVSASATAHGGRASYVSTGLLPLRLQATHGTSAQLHAGEVRSVTSTRADRSGQYPVTLQPDIPWQWWAGLVLLCLAPGMWSSLVGARPRAAPRHRARPAMA